MDDQNNNSSKGDWAVWAACMVVVAGIMFAWQQTMAEHPEYLKHLPRGRW